MEGAALEVDGIHDVELPLAIKRDKACHGNRRIIARHGAEIGIGIGV